MEEILISVHLKNRDLNTNTKELRKSGLIPGIISFSHSYSVPVQLPEQEVKQLAALRNDVIKLNGLKLSSRQAVLVGVQKDPVKQDLIHFSLEALEGGASKNTLIRPVKVFVENSPEWIRPYHTIQVPIDTVSVEGDLRKIPNAIKVDLSNLEEGQIIHGKDLELPKGIKVISEDLEKAFVTVTTQNLDTNTNTEEEEVPLHSTDTEEEAISINS